jgi:hypothetical protein
LSTAPCLEVIEDGTASWEGSCQSEDLRLSWPEIPGRELPRCRNLRFEACARKGSDLRDDSLAFWSPSNLLDDRIRHDELVRELTEKGYLMDLA